jgi:hypothetical protein
MVTADSIRRFSVTCLDWADQVEDASRRQIIVEVARSWQNIATVVEHYSVPVPDLRTKLD